MNKTAIAILASRTIWSSETLFKSLVIPKSFNSDMTVMSCRPAAPFHQPIRTGCCLRVAPKQDKHTRTQHSLLPCSSNGMAMGHPNPIADWPPQHIVSMVPLHSPTFMVHPFFGRAATSLSLFNPLPRNCVNPECGRGRENHTTF